MRHPLATAAGALTVVVLAAPALAQDQPTAAVAAVGWWTRQPAAQPRPAGGFEVAQLPTGT